MEPEHPSYAISVLDPIHPAIAWVKRLLFSPFDLERWFVIGFGAWLATLGAKGGGGGPGNFGHDIEKAREKIPAVVAWVTANLWWILPVGIGLVVVGFVVYLVLLWLNCRGKFMLLHNVRHCVAEVRRPWSLYGDLAWSLFLFRVVLNLLAFVAISVPVAIGLVSMWPLSRISLPALIMPLALLVPILLLIVLTFAAIHKLTLDFAMPLMILRQASCATVWRELRSLIGENKGRILLYLIFQLLIQIVIVTLVMAITVVTCGLACCLSIIPYIGTVLFLPIPVFKQAYALLYLRQYGPAYDVFYQAPTVTG